MDIVGEECASIGGLQKMAVYETKARFYLVGSNSGGLRFRVLKIDRTEPKELVIVDDNREYNSREVKDLLTMIDNGNRGKQAGLKSTSGMLRTVSAFGIVGFVKFTEGWYLILITKRRRVAHIGFHSVYKIEDTTMLYIPSDTSKSLQPEEIRYARMFQNIDLSSNFYFCYHGYDITRSLQYNLTAANTKEHQLNANSKFVWNDFLLGPSRMQIHADWWLSIVHGFVGQSNLSIYGRPIYLTLIGRRSNKYAGTRFLKRGANPQGDAANEVETEQIVYDSSVLTFDQGRFTSFIQMRGSVPSYWSQDVSTMVPKPQISIDVFDPYYQAAAMHFSQLLERYGAPVIVVDLVKRREKKKQESILSNELSQCLEYLNQFLAPVHQLVYFGLDMARVNKVKEENVMSCLSDIAYSCVQKTGIFSNQPSLYVSSLRPNPQFSSSLGRKKDGSPFTYQTGVVRVNCVDCLDRTNTAQFAIGKVALSFQLYLLGVLESPQLKFDTDCVRMLEELYEDHGDTLALQYGGSQLVHRIKTYRKTAPWTSQSRDIMQTLSRYYSNAFSDAEKQQAINLFLGVFSPIELRMHIWELVTDYYLHHKPQSQCSCCRRSYTQWVESKVLDCLPFPYHESKPMEICSDNDWNSRSQIDCYFDYYRPFEFTVLGELLAYTISHSVRDFMPNFTTDFSPFEVRIRPGKRREESNSNATNPSVCGHPSTASATSSTSSDSDSEDDCDVAEPKAVNWPRSAERTQNGCKTSSGSELEPKTYSEIFTFQSLFLSTQRTYGLDLNRELSPLDKSIYRRYVMLGQCNQPQTQKRVPIQKAKPTLVSDSIQLIQQSVFPLDSTVHVTPPTVSKKDKDVYRVFVSRAKLGPATPLQKDLVLYQRFASFGCT